MNNIEENKLMNEVSDVLQKINKSKDKVKSSYFAMSIFEIKHRIKSNELNSKKEDKTSTLSNVEKMRYGKIGDNFLKGASNEYIKIIENIKKEEKKKFKEKRKQLQKIKEDGDKEIKKDIKRSTSSSKSKLVLIALAIGGLSYLLKKTYDKIYTSIYDFNINKILSDFVPKKIIFNQSNNTNDDGSSFDLETSGGEKVSLTDKHYSKNPIEEASKSFDNIILNHIFRNGFGKILNNLNKGESVVGYIVSKPTELIVNKLRKFCKEALTTNKFFYGMGADLFHFVQTLLKPFISVNEVLGRNYVGRYNSLMLRSSDEYTQAMYEIEQALKNATPNETNNELFSFRGYSIKVHAGFSHDFLNEIQESIEGSNTDFIERLISFTTFDGLRMNEVNRNSIGHTSIDARTNFSSSMRELNFYIDSENAGVMNVGASGGRDLKRLITLGISYFFEDENTYNSPTEAMEVYRNMIINNQNFRNITSRLTTTITTDIPKLLLRARTWHLYNEEFLKPRERMLEIANENFDLYNSGSIETDMENMIYFNKNISTGRKIKFLLDTYFNSSDRNKNFFTRYIDKMENRSEWARLKSLAITNHFADVVSPLHHLNEEDYNIIKSFSNGSNVVLISQHNNTFGGVGVNYESLLFNLINFYKTKLNIEISLQEELEKMLEYFKMLYERYLNNYKKLYKTSEGFKIETTYEVKRRGYEIVNDNRYAIDDLVIKFNIDKGSRIEMPDSPIEP